MSSAAPTPASLHIEQTPPAETRRLGSGDATEAAPGSPSLRPSAAGSNSPRLAKQFLLPRQNSRGGGDSLVAPLDPLMGPLDAPRPLSPAGAEATQAQGGKHSRSPSEAADRSDQAHALSQWDQLAQRLRGKQPVVFLDYDGTLTPIVKDPLAAIITPEQRRPVGAIAQKYPVAIVTGRKHETVTGFLNRDGPVSGLENLYFACSHGFDIRCPPKASGSAGGAADKSVADEFLPDLRAFRDAMSAAAKDIAGSMVEDNRFSISVHYRNVAEEQRERLTQSMRELLAPYEQKDRLRLTHGQLVYEIRPNLDWHKGAAVNYLLPLMCGASEASEQDIVPIYIGDDITDEDAFRTLRLYRHSGSHPHALSIFVREDHKARPSAASYVLRNPHEVGQFLEKLQQL